MRIKLLAAAIVATFGMAGSAAAQSTGMPVFEAPYRAFKSHELGASLSDPGPGWGLEGFYRYGVNKFDVGFRLGIADAPVTDTRLLAGVDVRTRILSASSSFPLDGALTLGLGGDFGSNTVGYLPIGLSLGRRVLLEGSSTSFIPYVHPVLTPTFGDNAGDVLFTLGLGVDIAFNKAFDLRLNGGIGDLDGVSISVAWIR